jgi:hypothetical protein
MKKVALDQQIKEYVAIREKMLASLDLTAFKLVPSARNPMFYGSTVRKTVGNIWLKKVRPAILEQQKKTCSICCWIPENDIHMKDLHLHEIEEFDFENKVCHLKEIELICNKCHAFQHIGRTKGVSTQNNGMI